MCKWLDVQVFSDKDYETAGPAFRIFTDLQCYVVSRGRTHTLNLFSKRVEHIVHGVVVQPCLTGCMVLHIEVTSLQLSPLDRIVQKKITIPF